MLSLGVFACSGIESAWLEFHLKYIFSAVIWAVASMEKNESKTII